MLKKFIKYYDAHKDEYDDGGELKRAENEKLRYKQFKVVDKTDKESKLDEETKNLLRKLKNKKSC